MYGDPNDPRLRLFDAFVSAEVTYLQSRPVLERAVQELAQTLPAGAPKSAARGNRGERCPRDETSLS